MDIRSVPVDQGMLTDSIVAAVYTILKMSGHETTLKAVAEAYWENYKRTTTMGSRQHQESP
jgi:hypothetical protein